MAAMRRLAASLALAALAVVGLSPVLAGAGTSARGELESFFRRAIAIQAEASSPGQARDDVRRLAVALFDGREASRRVLGPDWNRRTGPEREYFACTFTGVLEKAYLNIVQARLPHFDLSSAIQVIDEASSERSAMVRTRIRTRDGRDARLDYRMTRPDRAWLIRDVVIDGVSLVDNYRAQFARVRRRSSYPELVERMRIVAGPSPGESIASRPPANVVVARGPLPTPASFPQTP